MLLHKIRSGIGFFGNVEISIDSNGLKINLLKIGLGVFVFLRCTYWEPVLFLLLRDFTNTDSHEKTIPDIAPGCIYKIFANFCPVE